jgi:ketosteroid isomerase-like protein
MRNLPRALGAAALVLAFVAIPITGRSEKAPDEAREGEIKALERARQDAFVAGNIAALDAQTADDYTTINAAGKMSSKPQMMANLRAGKTKVLSVTLDDLKARVYGDTAILTGVYGDVAVTDGAKKENHARFTRIFVKSSGRWLAAAYQQTALTGT